MASINYTVERVKNDFFPSNTYLLVAEGSRDCIVIDPGLDLEAIKKKVDEIEVNPLAIIATHGHFDHIGSVAYFQKKYGIPYYLHEADLKVSRAANFYLKMAKLDVKVETPLPDHFFTQPRETLIIGPFALDIHNLPGHSNGSCAFAFDNTLFSGDILYRKGLGFNHFPGEDKEKLKASIKWIFSHFPDNTMIYTGHGSPALLMEIKNENTELANFINE